MNKINSLKSWHGLLFMLMMVLSFTSCKDDEQDSEAPYLEVNPSSLTFENGGTQELEISTNRNWVAEAEDADWLSLSKTSGTGSEKIQVSVPEGTNGNTKINITISNQSGVLKSATVNVTAGAVVESEILYNETVGNVDVTDKPYVSDYTSWNKSGNGSNDVTYSGYYTSVRSSGLANTEAYDGASGPNVVFFSTAPATFEIQKISLTEGQKNLQLTFGASRSSRNEDNSYDNTFDTDNFKVSVSGDGTKWSDITYEKNNGDADYPYWIFATANFTLKNSVSELYIKFTANESSVYRLDDITLSTGNGGQEIDLEEGSETPDPEPSEAEAITIAEIIELMSEEGTVIDASKDRFFEAIVQCDVTGGNYTANNLPVAIEGATAEKSALTLYGSQVDPAAKELNKGDKIKITLKAGLAKAQLYSGLYEVTGGKDETWCNIEKISENNNITAVEITDTDELINYQGMTITVKNCTTTESGKWGDGTHTFSANGKDFTVYAKNNCSFADINIDNSKNGSITGIVTLYKGAPQIAPRTIEDVKDFSTEEEGGDGNTEPDTDSDYTSMSPFLFENGVNIANSYVAETNIYDKTYYGIKLGTSSKSGEFKSGAVNVNGNKTLSFYAVAWKGSTCNLKISIENGGTINGNSSFDLIANDGATGNPAYTINYTEDNKYTVSLENVTENTTITFTTDKRAVICGIQLK